MKSLLCILFQLPSGSVTAGIEHGLGIIYWMLMCGKEGDRGVRHLFIYSIYQVQSQQLAGVLHPALAVWQISPILVLFSNKETEVQNIDRQPLYGRSSIPVAVFSFHTVFFPT